MAKHHSLPLEAFSAVVVAFSVGFAAVFWLYALPRLREYAAADTTIAKAGYILSTGPARVQEDPEIRTARNAKIDTLIPYEPLPYELSIELEAFLKVQDLVSVTTFQVDTQSVKGSITAGSSDPSLLGGGITPTTAALKNLAGAGGVLKVPVTMTVEAAFPQVQEFIARLNTLKRYIAISGITLSPITDDAKPGSVTSTSSGVLSATLTGSALYVSRSYVESQVRSTNAKATSAGAAQPAAGSSAPAAQDKAE